MKRDGGGVYQYKEGGCMVGGISIMKREEGGGGRA